MNRRHLYARQPIPFHRQRAGYYTTTVEGIPVAVERLTTDYGDTGWVFWIGDARLDYPVDTKRVAVLHLATNLDHQRRQRRIVAALEQEA